MPKRRGGASKSSAVKDVAHSFTNTAVDRDTDTDIAIDTATVTATDADTDTQMQIQKPKLTGTSNSFLQKTPPRQVLQLSELERRLD